MPLLSRCINPRRSLRQLFTTAHCFSNKLNFSSSPAPEVLLNHHDEECVDFLPWLEGKAGVEISSKLYVGKSACGRASYLIVRWCLGQSQRIIFFLDKTIAGICTVSY
uniref:Uncharacterized protein n=1 Tax=Salix viminalis TaxID=40686 RepID=A0A6N2LQP5_SALVM